MLRKTVSALLALSLSVLMLSAAYGSSTTWVMFHGEVREYGGSPAYGWCGVYAKIGEWAKAFIAWQPAVSHEMYEMVETFNVFSFYAAKLVNTTIVELNYSGADLYILGLWNVYNVTFTYEAADHIPGNYNLTIDLLVDHGEGTLVVLDNWTIFKVNIAGIDEISGIVKRCHVKFVPIPLGDVCGPNCAPPDHRVDVWDLVHAAKAYGATPGMPGYEFDFCNHFSMDFNFNFEIDIYDLTTIAANIDETY